MSAKPPLNSSRPSGTPALKASESAPALGPPATSDRVTDSVPDEAPGAEHRSANNRGDLSPRAYRQLELALAGHYALERKIEVGGMGIVYLASDQRHHRQVAIKVLRSSLAQHIAAERFLREIDIAARLQHPYIVPLHDSGEAAGLLYYVMPFVDGESLRQRLARERQLTVAAAVAITRDVAKALDYAHLHGVIHRDVKPANILLKEGLALVTDFGIARAVETAGTDRLTGSGMAVGTPEYISPEQAAGDSRIDRRTDVYSLACVAFEMLAGELPYTGLTPQAIIAKHMHAPIPDVRVVRPTISAQTQRVLATGLAKVPADRFASAGDFARAFEASASVVRDYRLRNGIMLVGGIALTAALVTLLPPRTGDTLTANNTRSTALSDPARIAVLYFDDRSPDSSLGHIADGLTEQLIDELSGVNAFRVISRNGVKPYRGRQIPFDSMVASLGVRTVVDGSVERTDDGLRVMVQLIDAQSGTHTDTLSLEGPMTDLLMLERDVTRRIGAALRRQMGRDVRLRGTMSGTTSQLARELMLKAQRARDDAEMLAGNPHPRDLLTAVETLRRADSLLQLAQVADPKWLRPVLNRGWLAHQRAGLARGDARVAALQEAMRHAEHAVSRAPESAEALNLRGTVEWRLVTELEAAQPDPARMKRAEADLRAAVDRDSTLASAWATLSYLLLVKGSFAEAALVARRALREDAYLDGARDVVGRLFFSALMLNDLRQADEWCQRGRVSSPGDWLFLECELTLMRHDIDARPDASRAWELVRQLERLDPQDKASAAGRTYHTIYRRVVAATISARAGRHDIARAEIARARQATAGDSALRLDLAYDEAYLRLVLGQREQATRLLRHLLSVRPVLRPMLERDPLFKELPIDGL